MTPARTPSARSRSPDRSPPTAPHPGPPRDRRAPTSASSAAALPEARHLLFVRHLHAELTNPTAPATSGLSAGSETDPEEPPRAPIRVGRKVSFFTVGGTKVRYAQDRPEGEWVQTTLAESIVGVHHRKADAITFARAARRAEAKSLQYGVQLEHRPDNPHDANAIAVIGVAEQKGWFSRRIGQWHIGYLDRDVAAEIISDLVSNGIAVAAELYSIYEGKDGFLDFKVTVLAPPGHSTKARLRAKP
jgi:HIRAN domain-containing protein